MVPQFCTLPVPAFGSPGVVAMGVFVPPELPVLVPGVLVAGEPQALMNIASRESNAIIIVTLKVCIHGEVFFFITFSYQS
jgi:hypothetical protein